MALTRAISLAVAAGVLACGPAKSGPQAADGASPDASDWPEGTVLAVNDVPILASEVAPWAEAVAQLYPEYTEVHCRRLALTNVLLPRAAARSYFGDAREAAELRCLEVAAAPEEHEPTATNEEGTWRDLGLELWHFARQLPRGEWSEPAEFMGRFVLVRLDDVVPGRVPQEEKLVLSWFEFPYVDPHEPDTEVRTAIDAGRLVVVDPTWKDTVPEEWKHRMKGKGR